MKRALFIPLFILCLAACKDKDKNDEEEVKPDKMSLITKKWKSTAPGTVTYFTFNADGSGTQQAGTSTWPMQWSFINDQKGISVIIVYSPTNTYNENWVIDELTESVFKFTFQGTQTVYEKAPI